MVTTYPADYGGVSTFTSDLLEYMDMNGMQLIVLSKKHNKPVFHCTNNVRIVQCWDMGLLYPFQITKSLTKLKPQVLHIHHEFFLFGGLASATMFPLLLLFAKLMSIRTIVTMHGVININEFETEHGIQMKEDAIGRIPVFVARIGLMVLVHTIVNLSSKVIVLNNIHRKILEEMYGCKAPKVLVIPHGIPKVRILQAYSTKKLLHLELYKIVLFFGYLTYYKGLDILIKAFRMIEQTQKNAVLIIGGGLHPKLKSQVQYRTFLSYLKELSGSSDRIRLVGFLQTGQLEIYLSAADLVVFPYMASFSTGGPLSIALAFGCPSIASDISSFSDSLPSFALFKSGSVSSLAKMLQHALTDEKFRKRLSDWSIKISKEHSWDRVADQNRQLYISLFFREAYVDN